MLEPITLKVGETYHLRRGKDRIVYAGMPSEEAYSIVQLKNAAMENAIAWNLFFPRRQHDVVIDGVNITVEDVTADEIRLRVG